MPKCTIDGKEIEVPPGTTVHPGRARQLGIHIPHFCWHPDLAGRRQLPHVHGRGREDAEAPDRLQHAGDRRHGGADHESPKAARGPAHDARVPARQPPDRLPGVRPGRRVLPAGQLHGATASTTRRWSSRTRSTSARSWTSARSCSTPSAACCARAASASRREVTGTNSLEFVNRGDHTQIATFEGRPITHDYAGNLADVCPVGALLSPRLPLQDAGLVPEGARVGLPRLLDRLQHLRGRARRRGRSACGRAATPTSTSRGCATPAARSTRRSALDRRASRARACSGAAPAGRASRVAAALDRVAAALKDAGAGLAPSSPRRRRRTRTCSRSRRWPTPSAASSTSGSATRRTRCASGSTTCSSAKDRNPNTQGCLDQGLGRDGVAAILAACARGLGQGARAAGARAAARARGRGRARQGAVRRGDGDARGPGARPRDASCCRRPCGPRSRARSRTTSAACSGCSAAVPPPGDALPRWELAAGAARSASASRSARRPRARCSRSSAKATPDYAGLDYRAIGPQGGAAARRGREPPRRRPAPEARRTHDGRQRRHRRPQPRRPGVAPDPRGHLGHLQELRSRASSCGRPRPSSSPSRSATSRSRYRGIHLLTAARGRHAEVRRLLHVRDRVPGRVHLHRGRRAAGEDDREVPDALRDRPPPLRLLRLLRRRLPGGGDHHEPRERPRGHVARRADHRPRPADGARQARRARPGLPARSTTTCAGPSASPPSSA